MFNLQPGQGFGHTGSGLLAFGLGGITVQVVVIRIRPDTGGHGRAQDWTIRRIEDDDEIIQIVVWIVTGWLG